MNRRDFVAASAASVVWSAVARADEGAGVTSTEIRIGNTIPYSGPASAYGVIGKAQLAYVAMVNDRGGVNGRKIKLISLDNEYSPAKTLELTGRLVEQDGVLAVSGTVGTPTNAAIQKYLNDSEVPHILVISGASRWGDPKHYPWSMGLIPTYRNEACIYGQYVLAHRPDAKIAVLYQNDDLGREGLRGLRHGLGELTDRMVMARASYEPTDVTIEPQIATLRASGADTLMMFTAAKFATEAIRSAWDIGWRPLRFLNWVSASIGGTLRPAGLEQSSGIIAANFIKYPGAPQWNDDPGMRNWLAWMRDYVPGGDISDSLYVLGFLAARLLVQVLAQCGEDLTRRNIMRQALRLNLEPPMLLPGIRVTTSQADRFAIKQMQLARFDGRVWEPFGPVMGS